MHRLSLSLSLRASAIDNRAAAHKVYTAASSNLGLIRRKWRMIHHPLCFSPHPRETHHSRVVYIVFIVSLHSDPDRYNGHSH